MTRPSGSPVAVKCVADSLEVGHVYGHMERGQRVAVASQRSAATPAFRQTSPLAVATWNVGVAAAYFLAAKIGLTLATVGVTVTLVWPPSGVAVAAMLLCGVRVWPGIALGAFLANAT